MSDIRPITKPMTPVQTELYRRILAFRFDDPDAAFPFGVRLARDNGWPIGYAVRAISEYRKFAFLAMAVGHPVSPSDQVDQVWHLHIIYTHSYWNQFCKDVLGKPLHHGPTKGGADERSKFDNWYERTLESCETFFGAPPVDIWPSSQIRFGIDLHYRRVNTKRFWVIPRVPLSWRVAVAGLVSAGIVLLVVNL